MADKKFSFASKFNKTSFGIDTTDFTFVKLTDLFNSPQDGGGDVVHPIDGVYVHKSQLGDSPVIIDAANKRLVNLPSFTGETIREIFGMKVYDWSGIEKEVREEFRAGESWRWHGVPPHGFLQG